MSKFTVKSVQSAIIKYNEEHENPIILKTPVASTDLRILAPPVVETGITKSLKLLEHERITQKQG